MPDVIRLEPSEFELAERKKGKYLLAIVWGLEVSRKPDYVLISDPLRRLDRRISGRIHLSGIADLQRKSAQLNRRGARGRLVNYQRDPR